MYYVVENNITGCHIFFNTSLIHMKVFNEKKNVCKLIPDTKLNELQINDC